MSERVLIRPRWVNQHTCWTRAEFPNGMAVEWEQGAGVELLVLAEAEARGLPVYDPWGLLPEATT